MALRPLNCLSLCAGIGGLELGLRSAFPGLRVVGCVERDPFAAAVLVARMEEEALDSAPIFDDLRSFDGRAWRGCVDLVAAGYPCQPFSVAGKRLGDADDRHLWPEVRRIVDECEPSLVCLENVAGHVRLGFDAVLGDLAALGFDAEWGVVSASGAGAPHRRARLFVLAYRDGAGRELLRECGLLDGEREARGGDADGRSAPLGDSSGQRSERRGEPGDVGDAMRKGLEGHHVRPPRPWPPGPGDRAGWADVLAQRPELEPALRGVADGSAAWSHDRADRADRLRCLGNAVVPAQAAMAFRALARRALGRLD